MHRFALVFLVALLPLAACDGGKEGEDTGDTGGGGTDTADTNDTDDTDDTDTDDTSDTSDTSDTADSGDTGGGDIPDVRDDMQRDATGCEEVEGTSVAGAAVYFYGRYDGDATSGWSGQEIAYVWANQKLRDSGQDDCVAIWNADATSTSPGACAGCEVGMAVTLTYDAGASTCPEAMYGDNGTVTYGVDQLGDGRANWYFATSGSQFASGWWADFGMNFLTERQCAWF